MSNIIKLNDYRDIPKGAKWTYVTAFGLISGVLVEIRDRDSIILSDVILYPNGGINGLNIIKVSLYVLFWASVLGIIPAAFEEGFVGSDT